MRKDYHEALMEGIPPEVITAAMTITRYAAREGWGDDWEFMGLVPAIRLRALRDKEEEYRWIAEKEFAEKFDHADD